MRKKCWMGMGLLATMIVACQTMAQPGAPAAPAAAPGGPAGAAAAAGAAPGFVQKCCDFLDECRRKCCKTPCGQMINAMTSPMTMMSGGIIPPFCPLMPSAKDLADPGPAGAADAAKKDALEAKARREAVRFLGTLDCRYYPEAEIALITALRADRSECVRLEAAIAFANGCCCTKKVMEALEICVSGSERDGNPSERSDRVRDAAYIALNRCLACYQEAPVEVEDVDPLKSKEKPPTKDEKPVPMLTRKPDKELIERSKKTVAMYEARHESTASVVPTGLAKGQRTLFHIIKYGAEGNSQPVITQPAMRMQTPPPVQLIPSAPVLGPTPRELPQVVVPAPTINLTPTSVEVPQEKATPAPAQREVPQVKVTPTPAPREVPQVKVTPMPAREVPQAKIMPPPARDPSPLRATPYAPEMRLPQSRILPPAEPVQVVKAAPLPEVQPEPVKPVVATNPAAVEPMPAPAPMNVVAPPATPVSEAAPADNVSGMIDELLTGTTPNDRHQAIRALSAQDWKKSPQIIAGLVKAARLDSDRAVRVNAIRHLAALKIDVPYVHDHLKYMQKDQDEWVAQESTMALEKLGVK